MIVAGCDVGSVTSKAVLINNEEIVSTATIRSQPKPQESARLVIHSALQAAGLSMDDISYAVGTGYGKSQIYFVDSVESEIACHGRGAWWNVPSIRTVVDIGGQDAKAIRIDEHGNVIRYSYNDKCAAGTGRFLEVISEALDVPLEEMGELSLKSTEKVNISNQCVVFAETEVVSLINEGKEVPDIINGLSRAMANRAASLVKGIGVEQDVAFTGGVAKNQGVALALERALGYPLKALSIDPQINGALGAALLAQENLNHRKASV
jgi:predicted CoA-substrate-specific enzyme activase